MFIRLVVVRATPKMKGSKIAEHIAEIEQKISEETTRTNQKQMEEAQLKEIYAAMNADGNIGRMAFELEGYRYDERYDRIILYTPFEYRLYIPSSAEKYSKFIEGVEFADAHGISYNCKMLAYYADPDIHTGRTTIPGVSLIFRWLFN